MKILVLCTGNSCRSQMAEGILKEKLPDATVYSAGLNPQGVNPKAVIVMNEIGIDLSQNSSNNLTEYLDIDFDYIITVCDNAKEQCPNFPGDALKLHFSFEDPADATGTEEEILVEFRRIRDLIKDKFENWAESVNK